MGFTDGKDIPRTIRIGFTDIFSVLHSTRELTERHFVMDKTLYKGHLAWFLLYMLQSICETSHFA